LSAGKIWHFVPARTSVPEAVPPGGGAGVVLTGVGFGVGFAMAVGVADGFAVGFSMADLLGVGVTGAVVAAADGARLDDPAPPTVLLETSALETPLEATAEEARLLVLAGPVESVPAAAA
jgi:hypothetical protein